MQSFSQAVKIGEQTHYTSTWHGLKSVYQNGGIAGLFRGVDAAILRTGAGSAAQLPIYNFCKHELLDNGWMKEGLSLHLVSSLFAGFGVGFVMNPWDVILTRVYNQHGNLYSGPIDCMIKTVKTEGLGALYKGFFAQLLRVGPHTVFTLTFMEQTMKMMHAIETKFLP
ncbi:unnamed protein product [Ambrosiozyma monospora]|uniref:Unnamed protein product n=1 Tax=Ambrosiozyma monospora TaxID=43982 RepID=A0A9W7DKG9_AMBMO|nr:unnamed protein product [Ambrosiozyma monospora]